MLNILEDHVFEGLLPIVLGCLRISTGSLYASVANLLLGKDGWIGRHRCCLLRILLIL